MDRLIFTVHAARRMHERSISTEDVRHVIDTGIAIEEYPDDTPYPSKLVLGRCGARPIHIVLAENHRDGTIIIITVYEPGPEQWKSDYGERR